MSDRINARHVLVLQSTSNSPSDTRPRIGYKTLNRLELRALNFFIAV